MPQQNTKGKQEGKKDLRRQGRRQLLRTIAGRVLFAIILIAAAILALTVFFRIDNIYLEGQTRYTLSAIEKGLGIDQGHNLYLWNKIKAGDELLEQFPYLKNVSIHRKLPDTLVITVEECKAVLAVPGDNGYYLLSDTGKVLEITNEPGDLPIATGVTLMGETPGKLVNRSADAYTDALMTVLEGLQAAQMAGEIDYLNLQSLTDIRVGYQKRFDLRVGTIDNLSYRILFAQTVIRDRLSPSDIGRLYWDGKDRLHFVPESAEEVAYSGISLLPYVEPNTSTAYGTTGKVGDGTAADGTTNSDDTAAADDSTGDENSGEATNTTGDGTGEESGGEETYDEYTDENMTADGDQVFEDDGTYTDEAAYNEDSE